MQKTKLEFFFSTPIIPKLRKTKLRLKDGLCCRPIRGAIAIPKLPPENGLPKRTLDYCRCKFFPPPMFKQILSSMQIGSGLNPELLNQDGEVQKRVYSSFPKPIIKEGEGSKTKF